MVYLASVYGHPLSKLRLAVVKRHVLSMLIELERPKGRATPRNFTSYCVRGLSPACATIKAVLSLMPTVVEWVNKRTGKVDDCPTSCNVKFLTSSVVLADDCKLIGKPVFAHIFAKVISSSGNGFGVSR